MICNKKIEMDKNGDACQSLHIDREAWQLCENCKSCSNCEFSLYDSLEYPCCNCNVHGTENNPFPSFEPRGFCTFCGRPLTEEAWDKLEKRLGV